MSSDAPPVTVMIPNRDRLPLLRRAVASVWDQDYAGDLHVLVVVDGEMPRSVCLPQPPASGRSTLRVLRNPGAPGSAGVRNFGLTHVDTTWLALCDDDDRWLPHRLSSQFTALTAHPESVVIGGGVRIIRGDTYTIRRAPRSTISFADLLRDRIMELHPSTLLIRTHALESIGGWDEQIPGSQGEDYDLLLRLSRASGPLRMVDEVVADISWDGQSFFFSRWRTTADALTYLLDKHPEFAASPQGRARILGQIAVARAASGQRTTALRTAAAAFRDRPREPRTYLALAVASGLANAEWIQRRLHARGRGI